MRWYTAAEGYRADISLLLAYKTGSLRPLSERRLSVQTVVKDEVEPQLVYPVKQGGTGKKC